MSAAPKPARPRLAFLDWVRGVVAIVMLQGHTFHSLTRKEEQEAAPYIFSQFLGGLAPAVFLFLTGVTFGFLLDRAERDGMPLAQRWQKGLRRAGYLLLLAVAFRVQLWCFALGQSPASDLLKVDVLNCMSLTLAVLSPLALTTTRERVRWSILAGLVLAFGAPLVTVFEWGATPQLVINYLSPSLNYFSLFPWGAFIAFGVAMGSLLRLVDAAQLGRFVQWVALVGFGLYVGGKYFADFPYSLYAHTDFWLDSPSLIVIKLGLILLMLAAGYLWTALQPEGSTSVVRLLGMNSLLVYWVHIELVYGRWLGSWKGNLTASQSALVAVAVILLMIALCTAWSRWRHWRTALVTPTPALQTKELGGN